MAYSRDFRDSARRHLLAADRLEDPEALPAHRRPEVAGYLYGIAAECALKEMMRRSGLWPLSSDQRRDDPFYAHFPVLKTLLRDSVRGRRGGELRALAEDQSLMQEWDTTMRYAPAKDIRSDWVARWKRDAHRLTRAMEAS